MGIDVHRIKGRRAESVDEQEGAKDTDHLDDIDNDGDDKGILETDGSHEGDRVREDELHTANLLTDQDTQHASKLAQLDAVKERLPAAFARELEFVLARLPEGIVLETDDFVADVLVLTLVDALEGGKRLLIAVLLDEPAWRFGDDELSGDENGDEEEVEDDWDAVGPR